MSTIGIGCTALQFGMPFETRGGLQLAPFKYHDGLYGACANTTKYGDYSIRQYQFRDVDIAHLFGFELDYIVWASAENAFHGQKLLMFIFQNYLTTDVNVLAMVELCRKTVIEMSDMRNANNEFLPSDYADLIAIKGLLQLCNPAATPAAWLAMKAMPDGDEKQTYKQSLRKPFDKACKADYYPGPGGEFIDGKPGTVYFMEIVIRLKMQQYPQFKQMITECSRNSILLVEVSQYDSNWGTGADGRGCNALGLLYYELGHRACGLPEEDVQRLVGVMRTAYTAIDPMLKQHASLVSFTARNRGMTYKYAAVTAAQRLGHEEIIPRYQEPPESIIQRAIMSRLQILDPIIIDVCVIPGNTQFPPRLQILFGSLDHAARFRSSFSADISFGGDIVDQDRYTTSIVLSQEEADVFFKEHGIGTYEGQNMLQALQGQLAARPRLR